MAAHAHMLMACLGRKGLGFFGSMVHAKPSHKLIHFLRLISQRVDYPSAWRLQGSLLAVNAVSGESSRQVKNTMRQICHQHLCLSNVGFIGSTLPNQVVIVCKMYLVCGRAGMSQIWRRGNR